MHCKQVLFILAYLANATQQLVSADSILLWKLGLDIFANCASTTNGRRRHYTFVYLKYILNDLIN